MPNRLSLPRTQCLQQQSGGKGCCMLNSPPIHPTQQLFYPSLSTMGPEQYPQAPGPLGELGWG